MQDISTQKDLKDISFDSLNENKKINKEKVQKREKRGEIVFRKQLQTRRAVLQQQQQQQVSGALSSFNNLQLQKLSLPLSSNTIKL